MIIEIEQGDLTEAAVDAIVNAANTDLALGG
jgi:O-acetyl-ADP-ribose deacetylase (regulator of RNase III)